MAAQAQPTTNRPMSALEWGMLIALSVMWGGSFFFTGIALKELPPLSIVAPRVAIAAVILYAVMALSAARMTADPKLWAAFFGMGLLNNAIPFSLIVWGQTHIASGLAAILNATTPLFTVIVAHGLTTDEKLTGGRLVGVLTGLAGVAIMIGGDALTALGVNVTAQLGCLAAALSYAFAGVFGRRFRAMGVTPIQTAAGQVTASSLMLVPLMLIVDKPWTFPMPSAPVIGALLGAAAISTALGYIVYFRLLATAGATNLLLVTFLIPVSAIVLGVLVLGETLELKHLAGMALIGCGLAAIDGRLWRMLTGGAARGRRGDALAVENLHGDGI